MPSTLLHFEHYASVDIVTETHASLFVWQTPEMRKVIRSYNKMAAVLLEYELLYHRGWSQAVEMGRHGLNASLLVRDPETKVLPIPKCH